MSSCSWKMKLLVAADPWVLSEKTWCPGIAIPPGTQVLMMPHGLLVSRTSLYLPKTTVLRVIKESHAGEQLNYLPQWLSHSCQGTCVHSGKLQSWTSKSSSEAPPPSPPAQQNRTGHHNVKARLGSSCPPQFPGHCIHPVCSLASSPGEWVQTRHTTTWMQVLLPLRESSLAFS